MSPLDDELRAVLTSRADALPLVPDPIVGIERRARRMRRNRIAASVAGTALAVSGVAVAVPALTSPATDAIPPTADAPTAPPASSPTKPTGTSYALDPSDPWPYRGVPVDDLGEGTLETLQREYAVRSGGSEAAVDVTPLFGQVLESSQQAEVVFLARFVDGQTRWGVAQGGDGGPDFLVDRPLEPGTTALPAALPGDEGVDRLLVVAAPEVGAVQYDADGTGADADMTRLAPGVATTALEGDPARDRVRVLDVSGQVLYDAPAPERAAGPPPEAGPPAGEVEDGSDGGVRSEGPGTASPPPLSAPANVVDWPTRGLVSNELYQQALRAFARETGASPETVDAKVLYAGSYEDRSIMLLQAWTRGQDARTFGYLEAAGNETTWLGSFTAPGPAVLGLLVPAQAAFLPQDLLVVVPEPAAGQVLYDTDSSGELQPVADQGTEAAVVIERSADLCCDRVLVLDGNGDPERPIYRGTVVDLLATF